MVFWYSATFHQKNSIGKSVTLDFHKFFRPEKAFGELKVPFLAI